jgi:hypothetical protein
VSRFLSIETSIIYGSIELRLEPIVVPAALAIRFLTSSLSNSGALVSKVTFCFFCSCSFPPQLPPPHSFLFPHDDCCFC